MKTLSPDAALPSDGRASTFARSTLVALVVFAAITPLLLLVAPAVAGQLATQLGLSASQIGTYFFVELGAFSLATVPSHGSAGSTRAASPRSPSRCSARATC